MNKNKHFGRIEYYGILILIFTVGFIYLGMLNIRNSNIEAEVIDRDHFKEEVRRRLLERT
jgi:hypothetical protein